MSKKTVNANGKRTLTTADIELLREVFVGRYELEDMMRSIVKEEVGHLPTRDEFYEETSRIYKKLQDLEDEKDVLSHRVSENTDNIELLASKIKISPPLE